MARRRLQSSRLALLAGLLGVFLFAPVPRVLAEPIDPQANSLQSTVDSFVAYLKTETNAAMTETARLAREHKDSIDAAKARVDSALAELRVALSRAQREPRRIGQGGGSAERSVERGGSLLRGKFERKARDALAEIENWLRSQSLPDENSEIHV
jgi:hypothetical protein